MRTECAAHDARFGGGVAFGLSRGGTAMYGALDQSTVAALLLEVELCVHRPPASRCNHWLQV
ncbi:MAG: hypothetical protein ACI88C_003373 [Acidimicrobiales bacterium]